MLLKVSLACIPGQPLTNTASTSPEEFPLGSFPGGLPPMSGFFGMTVS